MKKKILFSLVLSLFLIGTVGAFSFSIQEERQISDYAPNIEYNHDSLYSVSGPNSKMIFENLDRNTQYTFVRYFNKTDPNDNNQTSNQSNIEEEVVGTFTTDSSRELSGDASFEYSISDYKNRKDFLYNRSGYIHAIKKDGEVVRKFGLNVGLWIDELQSKKSTASSAYTGRVTARTRFQVLNRSKMIIFTHNGRTEQIRIRKINPSGNDQVKSLNPTGNVHYGKYNKPENTFNLYQRNETSGEIEERKSFDMAGYSRVEVFMYSSNYNQNGAYANSGGTYTIVPRTHNIDWYPNPRTVNLSKNSSFYSQDQFGDTNIKYKDYDGNGHNSFNTVDFGTSKISFSGEAPDGFRLNVHPTTYTDTDLDGRPNRFDDCPEKEGYQFDGCPRSSGIVDLTGSGNGITGQLTENPTQTGIGVGTTLLVLLGLGIYFTRLR